MSSKDSFDAFAVRRLRIAGNALLERLGEANPWFARLDTLKSSAEATGRPLLSFGNYDYLGLAHHPAVQEAAISAIAKYGTGVSGSRLTGGERAFHSAFECDLARFVGAEATLALVSGYLTNFSLIPYVVGTGDLLLVDEFSHSSILMGCRATNATVRTFRHNDLEHLNRLLSEERSSHRSCLIVVESLYSMDGDLADLPGLLDARDRHRAWLMIDEAHSFGVLGTNGRGITEHFGIDPRRIDLLTGTLSKTFGSSGGFICASHQAIKWLRYTLPGFVFSVGLSPAAVAAAHTALKVLEEEPERVARLQANSQLFLVNARAAGLKVGHAIGTGIVPILYPDFVTTLSKAAALLEAGIYAPPVVLMGVPENAPRIRFFISADHSPADIERAIGCLTA